MGLAASTTFFAVVGCEAASTDPGAVASSGAGTETSVAFEASTSTHGETDDPALGISSRPGASTSVTPGPASTPGASAASASTATDSGDQSGAPADENTTPDDASTPFVENTNERDGGGLDTTSPSEASSDEPDGVLGIIGVGYGGIRIVSRDLGQTWTDEVHWTESGGDDFELLRTIAYGNGRWVSGGWQMTTSDDGVTWTDRGASEDVISAVNCQVTDGLAFGNGIFLAACGSSLARSVNGLDWTEVGATPDVGGHPYLFFDPATSRFACSGDDGASFVSADGTDWQTADYDTVHLCASGLTSRRDCPSFFYEGIYLTAEWGGKIKRSSDGERWDTVYSDQFDNNLFTEYAFAVGRVAP